MPKVNLAPVDGWRWKCSSVFTLNASSGSIDGRHRVVGMVAGDFDGDRQFEVALALPDEDKVVIASADGHGGFEPKDVCHVGPMPRALTVGDLNGDDSPDLAVGRLGGVDILLGNGDATFRAGASIPLKGYPMAVAVGHFLGGAHTDLAVHLDGRIHLLARDGGGAFVQRRSRRGHTPQAAAAVARAERVLTLREAQVAGLAQEGLTAREIGKRLHLGVRTVETHLAHAYAKLGIHSRLELIRRRSFEVGTTVLPDESQ